MNNSRTPGDPEEFEAKLNAFLSQIPTETSLAERRLLYKLFRESWDGSGCVVEIGPFLGGTTRAIAWGMMFNSRRQEGATLETFDRFGEYRSEENLREYIEPLVANGVLQPEQRDELCRGGDFSEIFRVVHAPYNYAALIRAHSAALPDLPEDIDSATAFDCLNGKSIGAVFVDGCKSWAATYYAMEYLLPKMKPGSLMIYQDFGWYTCFWISSFVFALREFIQVEAAADATYVYRVVSTPTSEDVTQRFSRTPAEMGADFFREAAAYLQSLSSRNNDLRGELISQLHHVAALATLNQKDDALKRLQQLDVERFAPFLPMIELCTKSPTFLPNGERVQWH